MPQVKPVQKKKRIALFGGAFDPVHSAHLAAARRAMVQASLDEVIFIPAAQSPLKENRPMAHETQRLEMLQLAIREEPRFRVDTRELRRGGVSYSYETVNSFLEMKPGANYFWILGADQFVQLRSWYHIEDLVGMLTFLVLARAGYDLSPPGIPGLVWDRVESPLMEESSTEVRTRIREGLPLDGFLPEAVEAFIEQKSLYKS